jgi:hypothetical protein
MKNTQPEQTEEQLIAHRNAVNLKLAEMRKAAEEDPTTLDFIGLEDPSQEELEELSEMLADPECIVTKLYLGGYSFEDIHIERQLTKEGLQTLVRGIQKSKKPLLLDASSCGIDNTLLETLLPAIDHLKSIGLSNNKIQYVTPLARKLRDSDVVRIVDLSYNEIDEEGGLELLSALEKNSKIRSLTLVGNDKISGPLLLKIIDQAASNYEKFEQRQNNSLAASAKVEPVKKMTVREMILQREKEAEDSKKYSHDSSSKSGLPTPPRNKLKASAFDAATSTLSSRGARFDEDSRKAEIETTSSRANSGKSDYRFSDNLSDKAPSVSGSGKVAISVDFAAKLGEQFKSHASIGKGAKLTDGEQFTPPPPPAKAKDQKALVTHAAEVTRAAEIATPATAAASTKGTSLMGKFSNFIHRK